MKKILILLALFTISCWQSYGQEKAKEGKTMSLVAIHEDVVHPSKVAQYEEASMELNALLKKHGNTDIKYGVAMTDDFRYLTVSPINSFADFDKNIWGELGEKAGEELGAIFAKFDECYDVHKTYTIVLNHTFSYNPNNENMMQEGQTYRRWNEYKVYADKVGEANKIAKEWKDLYTKYGIESGYRMYTSGLGMDMGTFIAVTWGKDANHINQKEMAIQKKFGKEGQELMKRTMALTRAFRSYDGWMRLDLSYTPEKGTKMADKK